MIGKNHTLVGLAILIFVAISTAAMAQEHTFQLSLFTPIQIYSENSSISGLRINLLYGSNATVTGLDWGLVNRTTSGTSSGTQSGLVNIVDANFTGGEEGFVNVVKGDFQGFQFGFVNHANNAKGFQLGFVNHANKLHGLQLGLINIIQQGGQFPIFPIVNWSF
jgi:hypothetical protein